MSDLARRGFLRGLGAALITAPAIVAIGNIMPVKAFIYGDARTYSITYFPSFMEMIQREINERQNRILDALAAKPYLMAQRIGAASKIAITATVGEYQGVCFIETA